MRSINVSPTDLTLRQSRCTGFKPLTDTTLLDSTALKFQCRSGEPSVKTPLWRTHCQPSASRLSLAYVYLSHGDADGPAASSPSFYHSRPSRHSFAPIAIAFAVQNKLKQCFRSLSLGDGRLCRFHQRLSSPTASVSQIDSASIDMRRRSPRETPHDSLR